MMWHFVRGYVILRIEAMAVERILNALLAAGIRVWRVRRIDAHRIELRMPMSGVLNLFQMRRRYRFRLRILKKCGWPVLVFRLWRRKALLFGTLLVFIAFCLLSTRVLFITVHGCERMDEQVLLQTLHEAGVERFMRHRGVDYVRIANDTAALYDQIAWLGLHREGVFLTVEVKEAIPLPVVEDYTVPCDVVAVKDGVVVSVTQLRGKALVRTGDRVREGQVLISGTVQYKDAPPYRTRARGTVMAAVVYEARVKAPETEQILTETGREMRFFRFRLGTDTAVGARCPYPVFQEEITHAAAVAELFSNVVMETGVWRELSETARPLTASERRERAEVLAEKAAVEQMSAGADVIVKTVWTEEADGALYGVCRITAEESIGIQRESVHGANGAAGED